jgi:hypothetical protein
VLAAQRNETELALTRQAGERVAGVRGQRRVAPQMVLRRVERAGRGAELLGHDDAGAVEVDPLPPQRVKLAGAKAGECSDLQPRRKRWTRQFAGVRDDLPYLLLGRWLLVALALAA